MRFAAILNGGGGSLRTLDLDDFAARLDAALREAGHVVDVEIVEGKQIVKALARAAARDDIDIVLAGGGDGTISAAASCLMQSEKSLAVLPAGTMNLFARALAIPLDLEQAIAALAQGEIREVDMARVNDRPFVHQYSVGMHATMIRRREELDFKSRFGKMKASLLAFYQALARPPLVEVHIAMDGQEIVRRASAIGVTNNLFGEGHLPYADDPAGGKLGVYVTVARGKAELLKVFLNLLLGRWRENPQVEMFSAEAVNLSIRPLRHRMDAALDGELIPFERKSEIRILPRSLKVLAPAPAA